MSDEFTGNTAGEASLPSDSAAGIVQRLLAGAITPERAVGEIRALVRAGVAGAMVPGQPRFTFQDREKGEGYVT